MKIAITGATGLIGQALVKALRGAGHEVIRIVRSKPGAGDVVWNIGAGKIESAKLEGVDGVVHLAGENIGAKRWTKARKEQIRSSRVDGTRLLAETLASLTSPPKVLVSASAVGYYGDRGDLVCDESTPPGEGYLPDVCRLWEEATQPAERAGIRIVHVRTGVVLSAQEGALAKMLTPFRLGVGGVVGSGRQYFSWITLDDIVRIYLFCLQNDSVRGPINGVSPRPVTNAEFTKALGRVLHRPTIFPLPAFAARIMLGEMADGLLLASARVVPTALEQHGFRLQNPELEPALRQVLQK